MKFKVRLLQSTKEFTASVGIFFIALVVLVDWSKRTLNFTISDQKLTNIIKNHVEYRWTQLDETSKMLPHMHG